MLSDSVTDSVSGTADSVSGTVLRTESDTRNLQSLTPKSDTGMECVYV